MRESGCERNFETNEPAPRGQSAISRSSTERAPFVTTGCAEIPRQLPTSGVGANSGTAQEVGADAGPDVERRPGLAPRQDRHLANKPVAAASAGSLAGIRSERIALQDAAACCCRLVSDNLGTISDMNQRSVAVVSPRNCRTRRLRRWCISRCHRLNCGGRVTFGGADAPSCEELL